MKKKIVFILIGSTVIIEIILRIGFGFCDTVLFYADNDFEYLAKPNQERHRFGSHISYNAKSMRSEEVDSSAYIILGLGDSVINGGVLTDQSDLATTILSDTLSKIEKKTIQFLNISAGSWGPDNCYAYIKKHGAFNAKEIWLFVSSHDAYDNMDYQEVINVHPSYPSNQYTFALYELLDRYLWPRVSSKIKNEIGNDNERKLLINKRRSNSEFNTGFKNIFNYSLKHHMPLNIYLHADKKEMHLGKYNEQGQEILEFAKSNNIRIVKDLDYDMEDIDFRDGIHLSEIGQHKLVNIVLINMINN